MSEVKRWGRKLNRKLRKLVGRDTLTDHVIECAECQALIRSMDQESRQS